MRDAGSAAGPTSSAFDAPRSQTLADIALIGRGDWVWRTGRLDDAAEKS